MLTITRATPGSTKLVTGSDFTTVSKQTKHHAHQERDLELKKQLSGNFILHCVQDLFSHCDYSGPSFSQPSRMVALSREIELMIPRPSNHLPLDAPWGETLAPEMVQTRSTISKLVRSYYKNFEISPLDNADTHTITRNGFPQYGLYIR